MSAPRRVGEEPDEIARRKGDAIRRTLTEAKVEAWLAGSLLMADRPTLADLESCGYRVEAVAATP